MHRATLVKEKTKRHLRVPSENKFAQDAAACQSGAPEAGRKPFARLAPAIKSYPFRTEGSFIGIGYKPGLLAWIMMVPVVVFAAHGIQKLTPILTRAKNR
jgi:hypothetical protein